MGFSLLSRIPRPYVLKRHRDQENPPRWMLRTLPARWFGRIDADTMKTGDQAKQMEILSWCVAVGLVAVEGIEIDGQPLVIEQPAKRDINGMSIDGGCPFEVIDAMPIEVLTELAGEIITRNTLSAADRGN